MSNYKDLTNIKSISDTPTWIANNTYSIGEQIRRVREGLGMTQAQLAQRSSFSQSFIADIENKKRENLQFSTLQKLASALNCQPLFQIVPEKNISQMLDEKSTKMAKMIVAGSAGSAAIELQSPSSELIEKQILKVKQDILDHHRSALWQ